MQKFLFLLAAAGLIGCSEQNDMQFESSNFELVTLADGVFACVHRIGGRAISNAGVIDNGSETIVFDCFLDPKAAEELLKVVDMHGLSPVAYVVNSHDHNDHIRGSQVFADSVQVISTSATAALIAEWEPQQIAYEKEHAGARFAEYDSLKRNFTGDTASKAYREILMWHPYYEVLMESHEAVRTRLPDRMVDETTELNGPSRRVRLIPGGPGHTESDMILYLPDDGIVFTADLVFSQCHPFLAHGDLPAWKDWLERIKGLEPQTVVPGHGPVGGAGLIDGMLSYMEDLESIARELAEKGGDIESADESLIPTAYRDHMFERFFVPNLVFLHGRAIAEQETEETATE